MESGEGVSGDTRFGDFGHFRPHGSCIEAFWRAGSTYTELLYAVMVFGKTGISGKTTLPWQSF